MTDTEFRCPGGVERFRPMLRTLISASCVFALVLVGAGTQVDAESCSPTVIEREISGSVFTALKFSAASTCEWVVPTGVVSVDLLVVGGGGGASTGGGGGGGVLERSNYSVTSGETVNISVGERGPRKFKPWRSRFTRWGFVVW